MLSIFPTQRLVYAMSTLLGVFIVMGVMSYFMPGDWSTGFWLLSGLFFVVLLFDALRLWWCSRKITVSIKRQLPQHFIVNQENAIRLSIRHSGNSNLSLSLFDHFPTSFVLAGQTGKTMPQTLTLAAEQFAEIEYVVKPIKRGKGVFSGTQIRMISTWGLWQQAQFIKQKDSVKTYPDFRQIDGDELVSDNSQQHGSIAHQRQRGSGTDFSELREYRVGDALNQIDYKASAKMNKLISKSFQVERDQQVMILLDCSRGLRLFQSALSHFDYALNTSTYLARTILKQGDAVGLMTFGLSKERYVKPRKGRQHVNRLLNQLYDIDPSQQPPDYIQAAQSFMKRQKRRSLVIVMTSLQEEDKESIQTMLSILQKRHIVLLVNLKENLLDEAINIKQFDDAVYYAARETYHKQRDDMLQKINNKQLILLDTYPQGLTAKLINTYINIKQSGFF